MNDRSTDFHKGRLQDAVAASRIQPSTLARTIGVPVAEVSGAFSGQSVPGSELQDALARELGVKPGYFAMPRWEAGEGPVFERSLSPGTKQQRLRARQYMGRMAEIAHFVGCIVPLPQCDLPTLSETINWQDLPARQIEEMAEELRRAWGAGDGPMDRLTARAEERGVLVGLLVMNEHSLTGCSRWDLTLERPCVLVGADHGDACHRRFVLASEIGHLVLHRHATQQELADRSNFGLAGRQAQRFASTLLAPGATFGPEAQTATLDGYADLKQRWQMPISEMIAWAREQGRLTDRQARDANIAYHRRGWNREEPAAHNITQETPSLLRRAVEAGVGEGRFTPCDVAAALPFLPAEAETLAGLPPGYLNSNGKEGAT